MSFNIFFFKIDTGILLNKEGIFFKVYIIISRCFWLPEKLNSPWNLDKILLPSVSITPNAVILASMQHKYS